METSPPFGTPQLFLTDSRLALTMLNHLRYQALNRVFGTSREDANALAAVLLLGAAGSAYETTQRIRGMRLGAYNAGIGAAALHETTLAIAGPSARAAPGFAALVAFALLGGLAAPGLRRAVHTMRAAERRIRRARIARYAALRDRTRVSEAS
jgi:hypothetical protein